MSRVLEKFFVVCVLLLSASAGMSLWFSQSGSDAYGADGDPALQIIWAVIYLVVLVMALRDWAELVRLTLSSPWTTLLVLYAVASVLWSPYPDVTIRRGLALVGTTIFGAYMAMRFSLEEQLDLVCSALAIGSIASVVVAAVAPDLAFMLEGAMRGVFMHKNTLGRAMCLNIVCLGLLWSRRQWSRWAVFGLGCLSLALVVLSHSGTSLIVLLITCAAIPLYKALQLKPMQVVVSVCVFLVAASVFAMLVWSNLDVVFALMQKDGTLTGRTQIWQAALFFTNQRPLLGAGYNAFWLTSGRDAIHVSAGWGANEAHNGFLELMLDLGVVGVALFLLSFVHAFSRAVRWCRTEFAQQRLWPLLFLTMLFFFNFTEAVVLVRSELFWILYAATVFSLCSLPGKSTDSEAFDSYFIPDLQCAEGTMGTSRATTSAYNKD